MVSILTTFGFLVLALNNRVPKPMIWIFLFVYLNQDNEFNMNLKQANSYIQEINGHNLDYTFLNLLNSK